MSRFLVTGGLGFIGSNFIRLFLRNNPNDEIINLDKVTYCGNPKNLKDIETSGNYRFIKGDICDVGLMDDIVEGVKGIIHFAAETHVDRSIEASRVFLETNIIGTQTLLDAARRNNVPRFVHVSTDEVYGSIEKGSFKETDPLKPNSPYAASKAAADLLVRSYKRTYNFPAIIVRSTNNFGPYQYPEKVIPLFITNLIDNKKVPLYAKGSNRRDWIFVEDNCAAIELILRKGKEGEVYNIGSGNEMSNLELTRTILDFFSKSDDTIEYVADRPGHDFRYSLDTARIEALGFKPSLSFKESLEKTIKWYRSNEDWWRPLKKNKYTVKL